MATYLEAVKHLDLGEHKRLMWVCGPERRLVEEVVDRYRVNTGVARGDVVRLTVGERSVDEVWSEMSVYPASTRLIVVRSANLITDWEPFLDWNFDPVPGVFACFVSDESNVDTKTEFMEVFKRHRFVRCGPFHQFAQAHEVLNRHCHIDVAEAELLLARTRGDLSASLACLEKAAHFSRTAPVPAPVVMAFSTPAPAEDYVGAVVDFRKAEAMEAARSVTFDQLGSVLGLLDWKLDALARLNVAMRSSTDLRDLARLTRLDVFHVRELLHIARRYDRERLRQATEAVAFIDGQVSDGETDLALETLVMLWAA